MDWKTSTVTFAVQTDTSTIHEPEPVREPNVQMTIIKAYFSVICRSLWIIFLTLYLSNHSPRPAPSRWHHVATQPAFQIPQYTQTGPQSYIFGFDIIHNSSINSTSHFLSVSCTFLTLPVYISPPDRLTVHPSYICSVPLSRLYFIVAHLFSFFPCFFFFSTIHHFQVLGDFESHSVTAEGDGKTWCLSDCCPASDTIQGQTRPQCVSLFFDRPKQTFYVKLCQRNLPWL